MAVGEPIGADHVSTRFTPLPVIERVDRSALATMWPEWDDVVADATSPMPFLSSAWIEPWLATLGADADLEVITARDPVDGRLLGVAPFFVETRRRAGISHRALRLLGSGPLAPDHLDLVARHDHEARIGPALWRALGERRRWDVIDLDGVIADGVLAGLVLRRRHDRPARMPCPYLPIEGGWETVSARFGNGILKNLGRYGRKLDREAGAPVVERMVATEADLDPTLDALFALHQRIRVEAGDRGAFADPEVRSFHRLAARRLLAAGRLRLHRLDVGSDIIAAIHCFRYGDRVSFYSTGYDPAWRRYGPGRRIMAAAIRSAVDEGATEFDFLRGDEAYKRSWGTRTRFDLRLWRPSSPLGRVMWLDQAGRRIARRLIRR